MKKRIEWLDFAKGITIFFVVFGHSLSSVNTTQNIHQFYFDTLMGIIFIFIMPCFFALSGYLYKPIHNVRDYFLMIRKKIIGLGIPYIIFSILYVFMQNVSSNSVNHYHSYSDLLYIFSTPIAYLWFLYALFFIFIIIGLFDLLSLNIYVKFILCLILMAISIFSSHSLWIGIQSSFNNILYFYIGYCIRIYIKNDKYSKITYSKITTFILSLIFIIMYMISTKINSYIFIDLLIKIISIFTLFQISFIIPHNNVFKYFKKFGKYTLVIYLFHGPVMSIFKFIGFKLLTINSINAIFFSLFLTIFVWNMSIFACYLTNKFKIINIIFYPTKYIHDFFSHKI